MRLAARGRMAEHKTKPPDHDNDSASGQEGSGRQHPTGTGPAYRAPKERGSAGGKPGGKGTHRQGGSDLKD
jgi:hypothetical protein